MKNVVWSSGQDSEGDPLADIGSNPVAIQNFPTAMEV